MKKCESQQGGMEYFFTFVDEKEYVYNKSGRSIGSAIEVF